MYMSVSTIKLKITALEGVVYENDVFQVTIPTASGEITILPNHISLVSILSVGELKIKNKNGEQAIAVSGGFIEMRGNNELIILADNAERAEHIDLERAEAARKRAEEQMKQAKSREDVDFARLQA